MNLEKANEQIDSLFESKTVSFKTERSKKLFINKIKLVVKELNESDPASNMKQPDVSKKNRINSRMRGAVHEAKPKTAAEKAQAKKNPNGVTVMTSGKSSKTDKNSPFNK